jgi:hypothetical protein
MKWLDKLLKSRHPVSDECGLVAGFVVIERATGRTVHREVVDLCHLSVKRAAYKKWSKRQRLEWTYTPWRYDVQAITFNSRQACERYFQE